ncbi:hypothetical protein [Variovorax sp. Sphag1AA]|uniref:hypothetical protein n=1 Tax=Variovorax sp. Sphag1AA TaxID=2587027 RepID=UPI001613BE82|nr:hypothetical protein [Variovorax sp. Sphag1AA]MBB3181014.1 hypothetical protein [Variovorax sp. Sphag1AA]
MNKLFLAMTTTLFVAAAYAQNPTSASSEQQPITNSKGQVRAQGEVDARPQGKVKTPVSDGANSSEFNPEGSGGKAAVAAQNRATSKPQGMMKWPKGDEANNSEVNPEAAGGKAAAAAQAKVEARKAKTTAQ